MAQLDHPEIRAPTVMTVPTDARVKLDHLAPMADTEIKAIKGQLASLDLEESTVPKENVEMLATSVMLDSQLKDQLDLPALTAPRVLLEMMANLETPDLQ